jgi:galactonate dehydratase
MQITAIEPVIVAVNARGDWLFVQIHTDAGYVGLGEASHSHNDALAVAVLEDFARQLVGQDPRDIRRLWRQLWSREAGRIANTCLSAIEQALWDILGQSLGVPIRMLFGGPVRDVRRGLRLYANINRHVRDRSPVGFAAAAREAASRGFTAIKLAPFDELIRPDHVRTGPGADWQAGVARVRAVREAIGDEVELAIDCHGRMEASEARQVAAELVDCRLFWIEEPVPHDRPQDLATLTRMLSTPIASGESCFCLEGFRPFLARRVVDVLMPDVKHDGGLAETVHISRMAQGQGLLIAPHNPAGPVSTAATAQIICTVPNFLILEYAWGEASWRAELLDPPERIVNGRLMLPEGPGLGHRLNPKVVAAHQRAEPSHVNSSKVVVDAPS